MSDLETIKSICTTRGVEFSEVHCPPGGDCGGAQWGDRIVLVFAQGARNVEGYAGFVAEMYFSLDGELLGVGAYE